MNKTTNYGELRRAGGVRRFCSTSGTRRDTVVTNLVINHEWGKERDEKSFLILTNQFIVCYSSSPSLRSTWISNVICQVIVRFVDIGGIVDRETDCTCVFVCVCACVCRWGGGVVSRRFQQYFSYIVAVTTGFEDIKK
jgi:hypothetical protein